MKIRFMWKKPLAFLEYFMSNKKIEDACFKILDFFFFAEIVYEITPSIFMRY